MAKVFLHIGLNKTGTSSLQDFFSMNAAALLSREGLIYPRAGRDTTAHHPLSMWAKATAAGDLKAAPALGDTLLSEIRGASKVVISSEDFHTHGAKSVEYLARLLAGHDVRVVLYLREHVAYLASWYQQNVQATHLSCAFDSFCYFTRKPLHKIAESWAQAFGRDKVTVRLYDRAALDGGDIVQDFAGIVGLQGDLASYGRKPYESNPSITGNLLFIKRLLNNFHSKAEAAGFVDEITALSKLKREFRGSMQVDAPTVSYVSGMYKGDRQQLKDKWGVVIEPCEGVFAGQAAPDFATLRDDWALVIAEAERRGMRLSGAARLLQLGEGLAALG